MEIYVCLGNVGDHSGQRIDRIQDPEEVGFKEDQRAFKQRAKRRVKLKKEEAIPYQNSGAMHTINVRVSDANWRGRFDRERPKKRRRILPNVKG